MLWVPMLLSLSIVNIFPQLDAATRLVWGCKSPLHDVYRFKMGFHFSIHILFTSAVMSPVVTALHVNEGKCQAVVVLSEAAESLIKIESVFLFYGSEVFGFYNFLEGRKFCIASR